MNFSNHLQERASQEKKIHASFAHIDMCDGDIVAGILLSQIVFWFTPNKEGAHKITIRRGPDLWLAKKDSDWKDEIRLSVDQARRARSLLVKKGLIKCETHKFKGVPQVHIKIMEDAYMAAYEKAVKDIAAPNPLGPEPDSDSGQNPSPLGLEPESLLSEITAKNTTETTAPGKPGPPLSLQPEENTKNDVLQIKTEFLSLAKGKRRWEARETKTAKKLLMHFSLQEILENLRVLHRETMAHNGQYGWTYSMQKLDYKWDDIQSVKEADLAERERLKRLVGYAL